MSEIPLDEPLRLEELRALNVLDTRDEPAFDRIVRVTSIVMDTPIALVSLIDTDRQWFKAKVGLDAVETPRSMAFCRLAIHSDEPLIVEDATRDDRFVDNPLVTGAPNIRFYAGAPLILASGRRMGTLCAIDRQPRQPTPAQIMALKNCAATVADLLSMRRDLQDAQAVLARHSSADTRLSLARLGHDLRTPLNQIIGFAQMIEDETLGPIGSGKYRDYGSIIRSSANHLFDMVDSTVRAELAVQDGARSAETVDLAALFSELMLSFGGLALSRQQKLRLDPISERASLRLDPTLLRRIAINLITNACRHGPDGATVAVSLRPAPQRAGYVLTIADDGPGMPPEVLRRLADIDDCTERCPSDSGFGLGLGIVTRLCKAMDWRLKFECPSEGGTRVTVALADVGAGAQTMPEDAADRRMCA